MFSRRWRMRGSGRGLVSFPRRRYLCAAELAGDGLVFLAGFHNLLFPAVGALSFQFENRTCGHKKWKHGVSFSWCVFLPPWLKLILNRIPVASAFFQHTDFFAVITVHFPGSGRTGQSFPRSGRPPPPAPGGYRPGEADGPRNGCPCPPAP